MKKVNEPHLFQILLIRSPFSLPIRSFSTIQYHLKSLIETFKANLSNINTFSIGLLLVLVAQDEVV
jgi:hypothetical protein